MDPSFPKNPFLSSIASFTGDIHVPDLLQIPLIMTIIIMITPVLKDLHRLPGRMRILFKVFVFIFKFMSNFTPAYMYINDLLSMHEPTRVLRHTDNVLLSVPSTQSNFLFTNCFIFYAPRLFNNLTLFIRSAPFLEVFKKHLKTYPFNIYF